jgi:hypothetical protein
LDEDDISSDLKAGPLEPELRALLAAGGIENPTGSDITEVRRWLLLGLTPERIRPVLEAVYERAPETPRTAGYFTNEVMRLASQPPTKPRVPPEEAIQRKLDIVEKHLRGTGRALPGLATQEVAAALIARGVLTGWDDAVARGFDVDRSRISRVQRPVAE